MAGANGQMGSELAKILEPEASYGKRYLIHLAWDVWNKDDGKSQEKCVDETVRLVGEANGKGMKFIFISTRDESDNLYIKAKRRAEGLVRKQAKNYLIIRMPNIIGKGVVDKFISMAVKGEEITPYGNRFELLTAKEAAGKIKSEIDSGKTGDAEVGGHPIDDCLLKELVEYVTKHVRSAG